MFPENFFYLEQWADILSSVDRPDDAYHHYVQAGIGFAGKNELTADALRCFSAAIALKADEAHLAHLWMATLKEKRLDVSIASEAEIAEVLSHFWVIITKSTEYKIYGINGAASFVSKLSDEKKLLFASQVNTLVKLLANHPGE